MRGPARASAAAGGARRATRPRRRAGRLVDDARSARSNMSIFSSWLGANPASCVERGVEKSTITESPCPMPLVSTMQSRSPALEHASARRARRRSRSRRGRELRVDVTPSIAFMRMVGQGAAVARRVDQDERLEVGLRVAHAPHELVGQARLAGAAGAGHAEHRHPLVRGLAGPAGGPSAAVIPRAIARPTSSPSSPVRAVPATGGDRTGRSRSSRARCRPSRCAARPGASRSS